MRNSLIPILLLKMLCGTLSAAHFDIYQSIREDLQRLKVSCDDLDNCNEERNVDSLTSFACHCGEFCAQLGTCCHNSVYVSAPKPTMTQICRSAYNGAKAYFMVDSCPSSDSVWHNLCRDEWNGEDDVLKIVPVTSLSTNITYKNYFCYKCNEASDKFFYWTVKLENAYSEDDVPTNEISPKYDRFRQTWVASLEKDNSVSIPVNLTVELPPEIWRLANVCEEGVISHCSETWHDAGVSGKCQAYMGVMEVRRDGMVIKYKNLHCALCNFEELKDISCKQTVFTAFDGKMPFSFTHLLDINRSDGDKVGKIRKCEDNNIWDPFAKTCRKLACAIPGYKVQNGKCVAG